MSSLKPGFGAFPAALGLLTLPLPLGWFREPELNVMRPSNSGSAGNALQKQILSEVIFLVVSQILGDTILGMFCLAVGTLCKVDPLPTPPPTLFCYFEI